MITKRLLCGIAISVFIIGYITGCGFYHKITSGEHTVYVTGKDNTYYHRANCLHVGRARQTFSLSEAVKMGYKPCPDCHPPVLKKPQQPSK